MSTPGHKQITVITNAWTDLQDTDVDKEIQQALAQKWLFGNNDYYLSWDEGWSEKCPALAKYIKDNNLEGEILLHYWW